LACIAFEDIGLGDLDLVAMATAAMAGKRARALLGGEWTVASFLTSRIADAIKCRGADNLLLVAENHPAFECQRLELGFSTTKYLIEVLTSAEPLPVRAPAAWFTLGTDRRPNHLTLHDGTPRSSLRAISSYVGNRTSMRGKTYGSSNRPEGGPRSLSRRSAARFIPNTPPTDYAILS